MMGGHHSACALCFHVHVFKAWKKRAHDHTITNSIVNDNERRTVCTIMSPNAPLKASQRPPTFAYYYINPVTAFNARAHCIPILIN
jgi:hypothetical protein